MPKEAVAKMKEGFKKQKEKGVKECAKDYKKDAVECVISASSMKEMAKCDAKKK